MIRPVPVKHGFMHINIEIETTQIWLHSLFHFTPVQFAQPTTESRHGLMTRARSGNPVSMYSNQDV
jgi:hypothetical protein